MYIIIIAIILAMAKLVLGVECGQGVRPCSALSKHRQINSLPPRDEKKYAGIEIVDGWWADVKK